MTEENPVTQDQTTSDRSELVKLIERVDYDYGESDPDRYADALIEAGWRKTPATNEIPARILHDDIVSQIEANRALLHRLLRAVEPAAQAPAASEQVCPGCGRMAPVAGGVFLRHAPTQEDVDECGHTGCTVPAPGEQPTISDLLKARVQQLTEERNTLRRQVKQAKALANAFVDEHAISDPASAAVLEILAALTAAETTKEN